MEITGVESTEHFANARKEVLKTIQAAAGNSYIAATVFKVTSIARMELLEKVSSAQKLSKYNLTGNTGLLLFSRKTLLDP